MEASTQSLWRRLRGSEIGILFRKANSRQVSLLWYHTRLGTRGLSSGFGGLQTDSRFTVSS